MSEPPYGGAVQRQYSGAFRPTVVIVVAVLTTLFSVTFLFLLYAKHCRRVSATYSDRRHSYPVSGARNSGIDRAVIESLPIFRFGSLVGHKDGLECSVCLNQFEPTQFLRLLPKCKHAFHVECVDTWLDAHSTCPLCRCRVDPEDVLLYVDGHDRPKMLIGDDPEAGPGHRVKRVIGRHSSAGERGEAKNTASFRRSLDDLGRKKKRSEVITTVGCFDFERGRKDGLLLGDGTDRSRFEHRIVVSGGVQERWSDLQPLDLLYLRSEMIVRQGSRAGTGRSNMEEDSSGVNAAAGGRSVINERSVSEITGLSRLSGTGNRPSNGDRSRMVTRWLAWVASRSRPQESENEPVSVTI